MSERLDQIAPFFVMQLLGRARELEAAGKKLVHMEIGEPDFPTPDPIIQAGQQALANRLTHYTPSAGLPELREAIANYYQQRFSLSINPQRILITPGASAAIQIVLAALCDPGEEFLVTDPGYPCNRHIGRLMGAVPKSLALDQNNDFAIENAKIQIAWSENTRVLLVASPSNPTGQVIEKTQLSDLYQQVHQRNGHLVVDEIYQGLQYNGDFYSALELGEDKLFVINSFSKFFGMTGWRVGWVVAPKNWAEPLERLAQNLYLAAPTMSQHAALAAFSTETQAILEQRRQQFQIRRDFLATAITDLGFQIIGNPQGAFYLFADASRFTDNSKAFSTQLLEKHGVAVTPGVDFGANNAERYLRFAYTTDLADLELGVQRLKLALPQL